MQRHTSRQRNVLIISIKRCRAVESVPQTWFQILALPPARCVTLGQVASPPGPQFLHRSKWANETAFVHCTGAYCSCMGQTPISVCLHPVTGLLGAGGGLSVLAP